jgi:hypothetical protein
MHRPKGQCGHRQWQRAGRLPVRIHIHHPAHSHRWRPASVDITEFLSLFDAPTEKLSQWLSYANSIFNRLEDLPVPASVGTGKSSSRLKMLLA